MQPINVYTSDQSVQQFRSFTNLLAENMEKPVLLRGLSELPTPDRNRPTRQQLLTERQELSARLAELDKVVESPGESEGNKEAAASEAFTLAERLFVVCQTLLCNERADLVSKNNGISAKIDRLASASTKYEGELDALFDEILANAARINAIDAALEQEGGQTNG